VTASAELLSVISSPRRCEILRLVWDDERSAGEIHRAMPDVSFAAVSQQLRLLSDKGLVSVRPAGRQRFYHADRGALAPVADMLEHMWDDALWRLKLAAELEQARRGPRARKRRRSRS
jgi:DNA-binding transcriptional ArsR family regulator